MKISFVCTVLNEEQNIKNFLDSISIQTKKPDEITIVDGGSLDHTVDVITQFSSENKNLALKPIKKKGNRSVGRNEAIKHSSGDIILCSDAGCILDKDWVKNITKPFSNNSVDVVAGYYKSAAKNIFQKCIVPYVFVMPDKVDPKTFLPATRSMAFRRSVWKRLGGFDESLSHNEDYAFARKLRERKIKIAFAKNAIVYWTPPNTIYKAFIMFFRFAFGDAEAGIYRPKAFLVIARYLAGIALLILALKTKSPFLSILIGLLFINYIAWAIFKNYYYIRDLRATVVLPILQFFSDFAVISGTLLGTIKRIGK